MWHTSETDDVYTVRGVPVAFWYGGLALLGVGAYFIVTTGLDLLKWAKPVEAPGKTFLGFVFLTFIPAVGLGILAFSPLIVTRFDRRNRIVSYSKIGLFGRHERRFSYDALKGGVHIDSDYDSYEGGYTFRAYFELNDGEWRYMCAEPGQLQGRNYEIGQRANEFLDRRDIAGSLREMISLGLDQ